MAGILKELPEFKTLSFGMAFLFLFNTALLGKPCTLLYFVAMTKVFVCLLLILCCRPAAAQNCAELLEEPWVRMENGDKVPVESPDVLYQKHRTKVLTTDGLTGEVYANGARGRIYLIGDIAPKLNYNESAASKGLVICWLPALDDRVDFVFADSIVISHTIQVNYAYSSFVVLLHGKRRDVFHSLKRAHGDTLLLQKLLTVPLVQVRYKAMGNIDAKGNYDKHLQIPVVANVAREEALKLMDACSAWRIDDSPKSNAPMTSRDTWQDT